MKNEIKDVLKQIYLNATGIICALLIDSDGIPISFYGNFELTFDDIGAILKVCYSSYAIVGIDLDQKVEKIVTEYSKMKIYQTGIGEFELIIFANRDANFGLIHLIATRSKKILHQLLNYPKDYHCNLMGKGELKMPSVDKIETILDKFV